MIPLPNRAYFRFLIGAFVLSGLVYGCGGTQPGSGGWELIKAKGLTQSAINSCKGDFYVFEDKNGDSGQPYGAVLISKGFTIGNVGDLSEIVERNKALANYVKNVDESKYHFVSAKVNGKTLCGIIHENVDV